MAHKIKLRAVPHINQDGTVGTKRDWVVRCKRRGSVCTHETFRTRREAEEHVEKHWQFVNARKDAIRRNVDLKHRLEREVEGVKVRISTIPKLQNFQWRLDHKRTSRAVRKAA